MTLWVKARRQRQSIARPAFTLIELMLVLTLIVVVAAMAAPAFHGPLEGFRLLKSADLVRARWAKARSDAMRTGRTLMFRYQPNSGTFEVGPWQTEQDYLESSQLFSTTLGPANAAAGGQPSPLANDQVLTPETDTLGDNVQFQSIATVVDSRSVNVQLALQSQTAEGTWSPPILFYPDGTSSTVRVILRNTRDQFVVVQLRGLSGVAEVSDLLSAEELPQ